MSTVQKRIGILKGSCLKCRVNCPFYFKIGACRHGDRCTRKHNRPTFSQTILIKRMYPNPKVKPMTGDPAHYKEMVVYGLLM